MQYGYNSERSVRRVSRTLFEAGVEPEVMQKPRGVRVVDKWVARGDAAGAMVALASYHCRRLCGKWLRRC